MANTPKPKKWHFKLRTNSLKTMCGQKDLSQCLVVNQQWDKARALIRQGDFCKRCLNIATDSMFVSFEVRKGIRRFLNNE